MAKALSVTTKLDIALHSNSSVATEFALMSNPKYRGPGFKWEDFPDMAEKRACTHLRLNTPYDQPAHMALTVELARKEAKRLVGLMTE